MHRRPTTVFLDRDGVINRKRPAGDYVERWEQFEFLPGAIDALRILAASGVRTVVVTNQRGVALGRMTMADIDEIHRRMQAELATNGAECDAILVCPHDEGACDCRKPEVGLFLQARTLIPGIDFATSVVIGDSASDMVAANRLGCRCYFVGDEGRLAATEAEAPEVRIDGAGASLLDVVSRSLGLKAG